MARFLAFCRQQWFLIALAVVLAISLNAGPAAAAWADTFPRRWLIAAVLFVTALPVNLGHMAASPGVWRAIGLAMFINTVAAPVAGYAGSLLLPPTLGLGLFVALASPCTMASAAVWTRRGGGNDAVALAVTLVTSLGCFVVLPGWTWLLIGQRVAVPADALAAMLLACVAVPVGFAQLARRFRAVASWADHSKPGLSLAGQLGVLGIVTLGALSAGEQLRGLSQPIGGDQWLAVIGLALAVHLVLLLAGWRTARAIGLARPESIAVAIAGSQKTLAVGVAVATEIGPLAVLPMIAHHVVQLVVDTLFVDRVRAKTA